jgi:hypothetical protein
MTPDCITTVRPENCTHVVVYFPTRHRAFDFWHKFAAVKNITMEIVGRCGKGRHCTALAMTGIVYSKGTFSGSLDDLEEYMKSSMKLIKYTGKPGSNCATILDMLQNTGMLQIIFDCIACLVFICHL